MILLVLSLSLIVADPAGPATAAPPSAEEVLARTIAHHDPEGAWSSRPIEIETQVRYGERIAAARGFAGHVETIRVDNAAGRFAYRATKGSARIEIDGRGDAFTARLDGSPEIAAADLETYRLGTERLPFWRDYFTFLYGLPMKLRDPGTRLDPETTRTVFEGREVLALRVTYAPEVGKDTWYFYVEPATFALVGCRFFHDESTNDGEFLVFEAEVEGPHGLRLPKLRRWYVNRDREFLATDEIVTVR